MASGPGEGHRRRSYRPAVEALEAIRLLSIAAQSLPELAIERHSLGEVDPVADDAPPVSREAWDEALGGTRLADLLATPREAVDAEAVASGIAQLNRYLSRAWYRAGLPEGRHEDSSQAVYLALLNNLGRERFDGLVAEIGRVGIPDVLSRETDEGPDFFRAIDTVKKRAQRERNFQPIETVDLVASSHETEAQKARSDDLHEAIDRSLSPREAMLIHATLKGETPAEIAEQWGLTPKTISNEKTRVLRKLREVLSADDV